MPRTNSELLQIDSMTRDKVEKYSAAIMGILKDFWDEVDRREHEKIKEQVDLLKNATVSNSAAIPSQGPNYFF